MTVMQKLRGLLAVLFIALLTSPLSALAGPVAIGPVHVIDTATGKITADRVVLVEHGVITLIGDADAVLPDPVTRVDGQGGYLIPGLAEMHAHVPATGGEESRVQDVLDLFLANGVTTIRGMLGVPRHLELRDQLARGERRGPRLVTSGPSFNGRTVSSPEQGAERVREQKAAGYDFLKIHPGLSREAFLAIAKAAWMEGVPFGGHVSFETGIETALQNGQATIDHLDGYAEALVPADSPRHGVAPEFFGINLAGALSPTRVERLAELSANGRTWQVPTQSLFETTAGDMSIDELLSRPGMDVLSPELTRRWVDSVRNIREAADPAERAHFLAVRRALIKAMQDRRVGLLLGSDAPQIMNVPGYSAHQELAWLVEAGLTPLQALQTGTLNVGRFLDHGQTGQIVKGAPGDLVLLGGNPLEDITQTTDILGVMRAGEWHARDELDQWVAGVRKRGL